MADGCRVVRWVFAPVPTRYVMGLGIYEISVILLGCLSPGLAGGVQTRAVSLYNGWRPIAAHSDKAVRETT